MCLFRYLHKYYFSRALVICLIASSYVASAQGYVIEHYHVDIVLNKNSSIKIKESISVKFTEKRRGIIRAIPFKYLVVPDYSQKEVAIRNQAGKYYHTIVRDIRVKEHTYIEYEEGDFKMVRIGDPDIYLKGEVEYVIEYTIWGAMNSFAKFVEFPFNVIGHDWDAPIINSSFAIHFDDKHHVNEKDIDVFTGFIGSKERAASFTTKPGLVSGKVSRKLNPYEGMTVTLLFPNSLFPDTNIPIDAYADRFYIENHSLNGVINSDASIDIEEQYALEFTSAVRPGVVTRQFNHHLLSQKEPQRYFLQEVDIRDADTGEALFFSYQRESYEDILNIHLSNNNNKRRYNLIVKYKLWGAVVHDSTSVNERIVLPLTLLNGKEPVKKSSLSVSVNAGDKAVLNSFNQTVNNTNQYLFKNNRFKSNNHQLQYQATYGIDLSLNYYLAYANLNFKDVPFGVYAKDFALKSNRHFIQVQKDGTVVVTHQVQIETYNPEYRNDFVWRIPFKFKGIKDESGTKIQYPVWNPFSLYTKTSISAIEFDTTLFEMDTKGFDFYQIKWKENASPLPFFESNISYKINGILKKSGNQYVLNYPLSSHFNEPSVFTTYSLLIEDTTHVFDKEKLWSYEEFGPLIDITEKVEGKTLYSKILPWQLVILSADIPATYISIPLSTKVLNIVSNNYFIIGAILVFIFFYVLWMIYGKDKKPILTVRYYPPKGITPAELGWLYDDRIHRRDLVSLIYYWGANGNLSIEEIAGRKGKVTDYKLIRQAALDKDAKPFEKIFYNGLFSGAKEIRISKLAEKFYTTLSKTRKSLESYAGTNQFYVPGSRGFGQFLTVLAFLAFVIGSFSIFVGVFYEDYSSTVALYLVSITLFVFGRIMPKKDVYGFKLYQEIIGFKEFMARAESGRLRLLLDENPEYFEKTIPYAIAFGMADEWSEKFEEFITKPPSWYKSSGTIRTFSTSNFAHSIDRSMNSISSTLSSRPSSSSGGSGYSGGSSGGGFGGGGGRSW